MTSNARQDGNDTATLCIGHGLSCSSSGGLSPSTLNFLFGFSSPSFWPRSAGSRARVGGAEIGRLFAAAEPALGRAAGDGG